jgi:hypothetical protein
MWCAEHLIQAARALKILTPELEEMISAATLRAGAALSGFASPPEILEGAQQEGDDAS